MVKGFVEGQASVPIASDFPQAQTPQWHKDHGWYVYDTQEDWDGADQRGIALMKKWWPSGVPMLNNGESFMPASSPYKVQIDTTHPALWAPIDQLPTSRAPALDRAKEATLEMSAAAGGDPAFFKEVQQMPWYPWLNDEEKQYLTRAKTNEEKRDATYNGMPDALERMQRDASTWGVESGYINGHEFDTLANSPILEDDSIHDVKGNGTFGVSADYPYGEDDPRDVRTYYMTDRMNLVTIQGPPSAQETTWIFNMGPDGDPKDRSPDAMVAKAGAARFRAYSDEGVAINPKDLAAAKASIELMKTCTTVDEAVQLMKANLPARDDTEALPEIDYAKVLGALKGTYGTKSATTTDTANAALAGGTPSQTSTDKPKPASSTSPAGTNSDTTSSLASPSSSTKTTDPKDDDSTSSDSDTDSLASASSAAPSKPASKPMTGSGAGSGSGSSHEEPGSSGAVPNPPLQRSHSANFPAGTDSYEVQRGDTLSGIAAQFGTTVDTLVELNNIHNRNLIHPHQIIRLPGGSADLTSDTALAGTGAGGSGGAYTVVAGDTLSEIAERHGTDYHTLAQMNGIANPHLIRPGQKIRLPEQAGGFGSADDASAAQAPGLVGFSDRQ